MTGSRNFDEDVKDAKPWEKRIAKKVKDFLLKRYIKNLGYETLEDIKYQKQGIDAIAKAEKSTHEFKTRDYDPKYYNKDILLETISVVHKNILGWLYTSQADVIIYCWKNESESNLMPIGYFILLKELRKTSWYDNLPGDYFVKRTKYGSKREYISGTQHWHTKFVCPPIEDFPSGTLFRFNALLPSNRDQSTIGGSK